jgi:hypothetical protein
MENEALNNRPVFTTIRMTKYVGNATVLEIDGFDLFEALRATRGNMGDLNGQLLLRCVLINGKSIESPIEFEKFTPAEMISLITAINAQLEMPS